MLAAIKSCTQSLIWVLVFLTIASIAIVIVEILILDFVQDLPYRSRDNAIFVLTFYTPIVAISAIIVSFLAFAPSQFFQALVLGGSDWLFGQTRFPVLQALPLIPSTQALPIGTYSVRTTARSPLTTVQVPCECLQQHTLKVCY